MMYNIKNYSLYHSIGIIQMNPFFKGNFKFLSTLINDGEKPNSFTIKISYTNNYYIIFGIYPELNVKQLKINLYQESKELFPSSINIIGYDSVIHFKNIKTISEINNIVNILIDFYHSINLIPKNHNFPLFKEFTCKSKTGKFKYDTTEYLNQQNYLYYLLLVDKLLKKSLSKTDLIKLNSIKKNLIKYKLIRKNYLLQLKKKYLTEKDLIEINIILLKHKNNT